MNYTSVTFPIIYYTGVGAGDKNLFTESQFRDLLTKVQYAEQLVYMLDIDRYDLDALLNETGAYIVGQIGFSLNSTGEGLSKFRFSPTRTTCTTDEPVETCESRALQSPEDLSTFFTVIRTDTNEMTLYGTLQAALKAREKIVTNTRGTVNVSIVDRDNNPY